MSSGKVWAAGVSSLGGGTSTAIAWPGLTLSDGFFMVAPSTATRPASISALTRDRDRSVRRAAMRRSIRSPDSAASATIPAANSLTGRPMNFASDNVGGISPAILAAIEAANHGPARAYGDDAITARLEKLFSDLFEHEVAVFPVATGTAA